MRSEFQLLWVLQLKFLETVDVFNKVVSTGFFDLRYLGLVTLFGCINEGYQRPCSFHHYCRDGFEFGSSSKSIFKDDVVLKVALTCDNELDGDRNMV